MELDPELAAALESVSARRILLKLDSPADIAAKRAQSDALVDSLTGSLDRSGVVTEMRTIPGPVKGSSLQMRLHRPAQPAGRLPCLYSVHSGGMVSGSALMCDRILAPAVQRLGCIGASIEYRLAPEHRVPAAAEDCYAGLVWLTENARDLGIDSARIALYGVSGGGGIAASTALMARDRGGPGVCFQQLIYPQLDDRNITPSSRGEWLGWTRAMNIGAWKAVLGERYGSEEISPYEAAARASDLTGLPPTYIEVGAMEIFRDESIDYAARLLAAGVAAELHVYPGCFHGFDIYVPQARISRIALAARQDALQRAWGTEARPST